MRAQPRLPGRIVRVPAAFSLLCALGASPLRAQAEPAAQPGVAAAPAAEPAAPIAQPAADEGAEPAAPAALTVDPASTAAAVTRRQLLLAAVADAERDQPQVLVPWIVTGVGVAVFVTGAAIGVANAAGCDGSCSTKGVWPWAVIAGCTITTGGSIWLLLALRDEAEARDRLDRARRELELDRIDRGEPTAALPPTLTLRAQF